MSRMTVTWIGCALIAVLMAACGSDANGGGSGGAGGAGGNPAMPDFTAPGPAAVGVLTTSLTDGARARTLPIEVWYPAVSAGTASAVLDFL